MKIKSTEVYEYVVEANGTIIIKYNGSDEVVTIPDKLGMFPVKAIGDCLTKGLEELKIEKLTAEST